MSEERIELFKQEIIKKYGKDKWYELCVAYHSSNAPTQETLHEKVIFRLLEMFDYECFKYGDNQGIDEEWAKSLLIRYKDVVGICHIEPPSYLSILAGTFDFLKG